MSIDPDKIAFLNLAPLPILFERATRPELAGRPFVVIGAVGNRGLVVAASPEAVAKGIRAGFTPDLARLMLPGIGVVEERPAVYFEAASAVQDVCERFVPMVEAERLDAFILDLSGTDRLYPDPAGLLRRLQSSVVNEVHLPSRAGLGPSRLIARLASMRAGESGLLAIPPGSEAEFLADYPVTVLPGIGVRIAERLKWLGVHSVRELARVPVQTLEAAFGPRGIDLSRAAFGHDPRPRHRVAQVKPLKREVTLEQLFYDRVPIMATLGRLVAALGLDLRMARFQTRVIALEIRFPDTPPSQGRRRIPPTDLDAILFPIVEDMFDSAFNRRVRLRGIGLSYGDLIPSDEQERFEFARDRSSDRKKSLEKAMDRIRKRYGVESIGPGTWWKG
jgi:DNA polymerase IV